ncbi:MAG: 30S ribosomal protein S4 [Candidatus Lokiarchaeota archaeon]|nr:30S ribosomal protein S4 [Candidatus Lokiarchaeota archaeon]MBD3337878.1 30S ribosomal protein S4 [Candidatus Lokiarchaeota archaeon]
MGDPRRLKKKFKKPAHPFQKDRIYEELEFVGKYGLRNKREFWKLRTTLGNWRQIARDSRKLAPDKALDVQQTLIKKLQRLGVLGPEAEFEDVLLLTVEDLLKRRLQTLVFEKGLAKTIYEARQRIVHGHIQVKNKKIDSPSYIVKKDEDDLITYAPTSPFSSN